MNSVLQFSIKVAVGGACLASISRYIQFDQNLFFYPAFGYLSVMALTSQGVLRAGWSQLAGAALGGTSIALTLTCLGDNPVVAGLCYIATLLLCEALQWQAFVPLATFMFPLMFINQAHGEYPWHYVYDRVRYIFWGEFFGLLVMKFLWPDKPRATLSNYLTQTLRDADQEFQAIVFGYLRGDLSSTESEQRLNQMQTLIQESRSYLIGVSYGIAGDWFVQDNWSELIAAQERLVRYLSQMKQTFSFEGDNRLWQQHSALLTHLIEQVSDACKTLISFVPARRANRPQIDIPPLSQDIAAIKAQIQQFRVSEDFSTLPTVDILRFYTFLDALTSFTEELQQLGPRLRTRQIANQKQYRAGLNFRLYSIPGEIVRKHLKVGLALGIVSALTKYLSFFDIKQWGLYMALMSMLMMQPFWGITVNTARVTMIAFTLLIPGCYLLLKTMGSNPATIAIMLFVITYVCSVLKVNPATFQLSAKITLALLVLLSPVNPTLYVNLWNIFKNVVAGICLALLLSRLFWPATTLQKIELSIRQTFTQMGQFYQALTDNYLQGTATSEVTSLPQSIQQSIQSQVSLKAFTDREVLNDASVAAAHQKWNFIICHERKLLDSLLSLQDAIRTHDSSEISQILFLELQEVSRLTAQVFRDLGAAVCSDISQEEVSELSAAVDGVRQHLENLRTQGGNRRFSLDAIIAFSSVLSQMKEITENLNQMAQGWTSSSLLSSNPIFTV